MQNNNTTDLLKSLEELYLAKDYGAARKELLESRELFSPGIFHYNLGTIDAKKGNFAAGRFHLEKALKGDFHDVRVVNNLEQVKEKLHLQGLSQSTNYYDQILDQATSWNSLLPYSATLLLLIILLLLIRKKVIQHIAVILILGLVAVTPVVLEKYLVERVTSAIVLQPAPRYEGPSAIFDKLSTISVGSKIIIREHDEKWVLVLAPQSLVGWVKREKLGTY